ncbi:hypothetical protein ALC53_10850 [Atta colombica]|uniref:Uncharacterized protein n=1 Tax=Atta colombica TaxID=520822 RepID=A0A195B2U1_9HYME|nr:hypothetical protein ALC53_10850 [Atta colombica]
MGFTGGIRTSMDPFFRHAYIDIEKLPSISGNNTIPCRDRYMNATCDLGNLNFNKKVSLLHMYVQVKTRRTAGYSRTQAGRVNAGSKVLVRTEFPTLDAGYEA